MIQWLTDNWLTTAIPVLAFLACFIVGLWVRRVADSVFERWSARKKWEGSQLVVKTTRRPFLHWFLLLGAFIAIQVSALPPESKSIGAKVIGSLFVLSLGWLVIVLSEQLLKLYLPKVKATQPTITLAR